MISKFILIYLYIKYFFIYDPKEDNDGVSEKNFDLNINADESWRVIIEILSENN